MPLDARSRSCSASWRRCVLEIHWHNWLMSAAGPYYHERNDTMTIIFVLHTREDAACAETIRQDLEEEGYISFHTQSFPDDSVEKNVILGSAAVVLVWSGSAAQSKQVKQEIRLVQKLKKQLVLLVLDGTALPQTLVGVSSIAGQ